MRNPCASEPFICDKGGVKARRVARAFALQHDFTYGRRDHATAAAAAAVHNFKILRYQGINLRSFVHVVHTPFSPSITSAQCLGITQLFEMVRVVVFVTISNYSFAETVK